MRGEGRAPGSARPSGLRSPTGRRVAVTVPLRWRDLDVLGHVHQGRYHEMLDEARAAVFAEVTGPLGFPFVLVRVELDHRREVRRSAEALEVRSVVASVGRSSVRIDHELATPGREVVADAVSVLVAWDREARVARPVSTAERELLSRPAP